MIQLKQKLAYVFLGALLVIAVQLSASAVASTAAATDEAAPQGHQIKMLVTVDYPLGGKAEYLEWVASIAPALQAPAEVARIASYDNHMGDTPHRFIEFEFESFAAWAAYVERPEVRAVLDDASNRGINNRTYLLKLRNDYSKE